MSITNEDDYEAIIASTNPTLHERVVNLLDYIPVFDAPKVMKVSSGTIWKALYRELENASLYDTVLRILNSKTTRFNTIDKVTRRSFIDDFPTLTWTLITRIIEWRLECLPYVAGGGPSRIHIRRTRSITRKTRSE